jgi:hypothetical protein
MPSIPDVPFTDGQLFTPEAANAIAHPVFDDDTAYLGHLARLLDMSLSDNPTQIKGRLGAIENAFKPTVTTGLNVSIASGLCLLPDASLFAVASSIVTVTNGTTFIWVDRTGTVTTGAAMPVQRLPIAKIVASAGTITALTDLRHRQILPITNLTSSVKIFGGSGTVDKVATAGEAFNDGFYYFRNFTVPAGISITVDKGCKIFCSGDALIDGSITVTPATVGAAGYATGIPVGINLGGAIGSGIGAGSGSTGGASYSYALQNTGSSGGLGFATGATSGSVNFGASGKGGGSFWIEAAGAITVNGTINVKGQDGAAPTIGGGSVTVSGSGGGSGGLCYLASLRSVTVASGAVIDLRGGNGSNGVNTSTGIAVGGGGGSGGWLVATAPIIQTSGFTPLLSGGSQGASVGTGSPLGSGSGGGFGGNGGNGAGGSVGRQLLSVNIPTGV